MESATERVTVLHGVALVRAGDSVVRSAAKYGGEYEPESMAAWLGAVGSGLAIDVGAYTGLYAIAAHRAGALVLAVEPNPDARARFRENAALNCAYLPVAPVALWDRPEGTAVLSMKHAGLTAASSLRGYDGPHTVRSVRALRLDDLVGWHRHVTAVKIDTERTELDVLRGATETIRRCRPVVIVEELDDRPEELDALMAGHGYGPPERADGRNLIYRRT